MKKILYTIIILVICLSIALVSCAKEPTSTTPEPAPAQPQEPAPQVKPTIKIGDLNWGSAHFEVELTKIIIEEGYGYPVEIIPGATIVLLQALEMGEADVLTEIWLQNQQEAWDKVTAGGNVISLGLLNNDNWQSSYVVPTYVIKGDTDRGIDATAPDLKTAQDLKAEQYKELFKDPEDPGKGAIWSCVPGWECEKINLAQAEAYGIDEHYNHRSPGSQESLFASLVSAYDKGDPWLGYLWGPTWIAGKLDLTVLEEPPYDETVWNDTHGCAYPSTDLLVAANSDFTTKAPEVVEMFKKLKLNTKTLGEALAYMDETGGEPVDAAIWHLREREDIWTQFVPSDIADKVKQAVAGM